MPYLTYHVLVYGATQNSNILSSDLGFCHPLSISVTFTTKNQPINTAGHLAVLGGRTHNAKSAYPALRFHTAQLTVLVWEHFL